MVKSSDIGSEHVYNLRRTPTLPPAGVFSFPYPSFAFRVTVCDVRSSYQEPYHVTFRLRTQRLDSVAPNSIDPPSHSIRFQSCYYVRHSVSFRFGSDANRGRFGCVWWGKCDVAAAVSRDALSTNQRLLTTVLFAVE